MKICKRTFHAPDRVTVIAGSIHADDSECVKKWPDMFCDADDLAAQRGGYVEAARARPGEQSNARAVNREPAPKPEKAAKKATANPSDD